MLSQAWLLLVTVRSKSVTLQKMSESTSSTSSTPGRRFQTHPSELPRYQPETPRWFQYLVSGDSQGNYSRWVDKTKHVCFLTVLKDDKEASCMKGCQAYFLIQKPYYGVIVRSDLQVVAFNRSYCYTSASLCSV